MADQKVNVIYTVVDKATSSVKSLGQSFVGLGKSILGSKVSLAALTASVGLAVRDFAQFETAIVNVGNLFGATDEEIQKLSDDVIELSTTVSSSSQDLAEALFDVVSAGVEAGESIEFLKAASGLAEAGVTTTKIAVDGLTSVMNAFKIESQEVNTVADKFFSAQQRGKTTIEELSKSIGNVAPIASAAGVGIDELLATISTLTLQGIGTAQATTGVRAAIAALLKPTQEASKLAKSLGIDFDAAAIASDGLGETLRKVIEATGGNKQALGLLFGQIEAVNSVLALASDNFETLGDIQEDVSTKIGVTAEALEKQQETLSAQFNILKNNVLALSKELVSTLAPAIGGVIKLLTDVVRVAGKVGGIFKNLIDPEPAIRSVNEITEEIQSANEKLEKLEQKRQSGLVKSRISTQKAIINVLEQELEKAKEIEAEKAEVIKTEEEKRIEEQRKRRDQELEEKRKAKAKEVQDIIDSQKKIEQANSEFFQKSIQALEDKNLEESAIRDIETSERIAQLNDLLKSEQLNADDRKTIERNIFRLKAQLRREEEQGVFALESAKLDTIKRSLAAELKALANSFLLQGIARASFFDPIGVLQIGASVIINEGIDAALSGIKLADGGIVRATPGGVRATIGEGGQDEAVIPLDSPRGRAMLGNNQAREIIIMTDDGTELTRAISGKQNEMLQTGQITR